MNNGGVLDGLWYLAGLSSELKRGAMARRILFDDPVVLGRTTADALFALRDVCPHRAAPLSAGRLCEGEAGVLIECPYHAWRFAVGDGRCAEIPALVSDDARDISKIATRAFHVAEANGLVWIYRGDGAPETPAPDIGVAEGATPKTVTIVESEGPFDEAVIGLVDPAHTPTVHQQWWWRKGAARQDKEKRFEPTPLGFRMPPHAPSSNSRIYKLLGGAPTTEIEFRLPALRLEHIRVGARAVTGMTAMTPAERGKTRIVHAIFWNSALFDLIRPLAQSMSDGFLAQDGAILSAQDQNLSRLDHRALYVGDADEPAKWYLKLKRAWGSRAETDGFRHPLEAQRLRWRT